MMRALRIGLSQACTSINTDVSVAENALTRHRTQHPNWNLA